MKIAWVLGIAYLAGSLSFAQTAPNPCTVIKKHRAGPEAYAALRKIIDAVGVDPNSIYLYTSSDAMVSEKGGALSLLCNVSDGSQEWIVYDPDRIRDDSVRDFVFAHELGHQLNGHTLSEDTNRTTPEELDADYYGARYLVKLGWTKERLLSALDQLKLPQGSLQGYPTLEQRRAKVIEGFDAEYRPATATKPLTGSVIGPSSPGRISPNPTPAVGHFPTVVLECECDQCEHGGGGAVWVFEGGRGQAMWRYGAIADLTVSNFDGRNFTIHRVDPDRTYSSVYAPKGKLFTAEYTGSIVGNHLTGKFFACTWTGDSPQIPCSSSASCPLTSDQMLELGKNAARAGLMSAARQSFRMSASMGNPTAKALVDSMLPSAVP